MKEFLQYLFYPNPVSPQYSNPKVLIIIGVCMFCIIGSFVFTKWRASHTDIMFKKLSASWAAVLRWFGIIGLLLIFSRTEGISYISMRFFWVIWIIALILYCLLQMRSWQMRYYKIIKTTKKKDARNKYLPLTKK